MISVKMLARELHAFDNNIIQHTDHFAVPERAKFYICRFTSPNGKKSISSTLRYHRYPRRRITMDE